MLPTGGPPQERTHDVLQRAPGATASVSLERQYRAYCRTQAGAFLSLIPRDGVRPLYARARAWAIEADQYEAKDPLETLVRFVVEVLPLPPFDVWARDFERNPLLYLRAFVAGGVPSPGWSEPAAVECRPVRSGDQGWTSSLNIYPDDGIWRGFISFENEESSTSFRTTDVFCENEPEEVQRRFSELTEATLEAFLRSVRS